jgi:hypothetical protein
MGTVHSISHAGMAIFDHPITSTIGGVVVDLVSAPISPGEHRLVIDVSIGGVEIYLPAYVKFVVDGGAVIGGHDVHEGHGVFQRIGRRLARMVGARHTIPDHAVPDPDPGQAKSIRLVIDGGIGGVDIYRL